MIHIIRTCLVLMVAIVLFPLIVLAQVEPTKKTTNIFTLGDSNGSYPYSWPRQLQLMLPDASVFNLSKPGRTIGFVNLGDTNSNALMMLETYLAKAAEHTQQIPYDYVVMALGTNDAKAIFADRQKEVAENLQKLIQGIRTCEYVTINKAKIIIIAPPPYGSKTDTTKKYTGGNARVKAMSKAFKEVADRNECYFVNGYDIIGENIEILSNDGIHLNAAASQLLIEPVAALIQKNAKKKQVESFTIY